MNKRSLEIARKMLAREWMHVGDGNYWSVGGADAAAESGILDDKYSQYQRAYMHNL